MRAKLEPIEPCKHPRIEQIEIGEKEIGDTVFIGLLNFCPNCLVNNLVVTKIVKKEANDE